MIAFLLFAQLAVVAPKASFAATCTPASNQYTVDASASQRGSGGPIVAYRWNWANGRTETQGTPVVKNTWSASGKFVVKLTVVDSSGRVSTVTQRTVTIPCPSVGTPPPTVIHDTIRVTDTLVITKHDTIQLPSRVDTVTVVKTDTISTGLPILPSGVTTTNDAGELYVAWNGQRMGRLVFTPGNQVNAYKWVASGVQMQLLGTFADQRAAIAALLTTVFNVVP